MSVSLEVFNKIKERAMEKKKFQEEKEIHLYGKTIAQIKSEQVQRYDHPHTMEPGTALALYIAVMAAGAIFVDAWIVWGSATIIYFNFLEKRKK